MKKCKLTIAFLDDLLTIILEKLLLIQASNGVEENFNNIKLNGVNLIVFIVNVGAIHEVFSKPK